MGQIAGTMFPTVQQKEQQEPDDIPWTLKYGSRVMGTLGSIICICLGLFTAISIYPICIVAGIFQMLAGFIVIVIEAPCCCLFIDQVQRLSQWFDTKPYWQKGLFYLVLSLPAIILCPGLGTIFGCAFIFITAVLYGMMTLGKKASREEMMTRAQSDGQVNQEMKANLMSDQNFGGGGGDMGIGGGGVGGGGGLHQI